MTGRRRAPPFADDGALPDEERALLDRARALIPLLAVRAPAATAARQLPAQTIVDYREAGILRILQPRRFGGRQGRFSLFSQIVEELTYGCASSAWVYAVLAEHQWIIAQYPEQAQIDVWGDDPEAVAASSLAPRAAAKRTAGGWAPERPLLVLERLRPCPVGDHRCLPRRGGRPAGHRLSAGAPCRS
jgi:3-hydroxy-9,10-secoandrosta-1,3,5(10)-triene-9,17-dione monooxygenase